MQDTQVSGWYLSFAVRKGGCTTWFAKPAEAVAYGWFLREGIWMLRQKTILKIESENLWRSLCCHSYSSGLQKHLKSSNKHDKDDDWLARVLVSVWDYVLHLGASFCLHTSCNLCPLEPHFAREEICFSSCVTRRALNISGVCLYSTQCLPLAFQGKFMWPDVVFSNIPY